MNFVNSPHPYGAKPTGNLYFASAEVAQVRPKGLGLMRGLQDEAILEILGFLCSKDLASCSVSSRCLYVYGHHSDLWRDVTLRRMEGNPIEYRNTWKETLMSYTFRAKDEEAEAMEERKNSKSNDKNGLVFPSHSPISVQGVFSNLLHRAWTCHCCDLSTACRGFYKHNDVARRKAEELDVNKFIEQYENANIPVIITGAVNHWGALQKWDEDFLSNIEEEMKLSDSDEKRGEANKGKEEKATFRATSATAPVAATFTLQGYFTYLRQAKEEAPLYLFERDFAKKIPNLEADYDVPTYFKSPEGEEPQKQQDEGKNDGQNERTNHAHGKDLFRLFGSSARPDYRWLICGPKRSGSIFHIDPNQTNAWNVAVKGRKKWIFYPPNCNPPGVVSSEDGADVTVPISTGEWLLSFWEQHLECRKSEDVATRPLECIVNPGELIFVPHGYWHMVVNLDDCIALTHNYVSSSNLSDCLRFLRETPDQISGVRDRAGLGDDSAVQPEEMYAKFVDKLKLVIGEENANAAVVKSAQSSLMKESDNTVVRGSGVIGKRKRAKEETGGTGDDDKEKEEEKDFSFSFF